MKTKSIIIIGVSFVLICFFAMGISTAGSAYNLNGEWNAVITKEGANISSSTTIEKDIIKISQQGNQFVGVRTNGGKWVGKNEEMIKGNLSYKMVDEAFIHHVSDPITFDLSWSDGRATITDDGNKIMIQSFIKSTGYYETVTLIKKQ
ncbi:MAG: hypothetical protein GY699_13270 [Desulfobacteraceae bacterium]|nr:hypothetical protein [Desulfobacteraceae bacterium]